jgi:hypothetical protein
MPDQGHQGREQPGRTAPKLGTRWGECECTFPLGCDRTLGRRSRPSARTTTGAWVWHKKDEDHDEPPGAMPRSACPGPGPREQPDARHRSGQPPAGRNAVQPPNIQGQYQHQHLRETGQRAALPATGLSIQRPDASVVEKLAGAGFEQLHCRFDFVQPGSYLPQGCAGMCPG